MDNKELEQIANIQDVTHRTEKLNFYKIRLKAEFIANQRFKDDVKYIYANCTPKSLDNGDFDKLCETLGFDYKNTIDRNINSVALSEIVKNKNRLIGLICDIVERISEHTERNDNFSYSVLCLKMLFIVCTKQEILYLYSCIIAKLEHGQIKAVQNEINDLFK